MIATQLRSFTWQFNENNQEFLVQGALRPQRPDELASCLQALEAAAQKAKGRLYFNVRRLVRMNNVAFRAIARKLIDTVSGRSDLSIHVTTSSVVGWATHKFSTLQEHTPKITVNEYDSEFYPGQSFLEDGGFIPILRTQTNLTWHHEKALLAKHGLREDMLVADICCGIGDFAVLIQKEYNPGRVVALDHSKSSLAYARQVASEFGIKGIDYVFGDASDMLLESDQFDFVTCRHSLQVFDKPELILKELYRICKPGGRVYITNEKNSHCLGEPRGASIQKTYDEVARLWNHFNMDIELGPKSRRYMMDAGFEDILMESFMVTNLDGDPQDFADIIQSWENVYAGQMAVRRGDTPEQIAELRQGFQDHIFAALHPKGYAGWPIWAASGRKPK
ncbi:ubiquinone/menaquinone biosynthesis C-methylase UbiE [Roseibium hamelinense]|uniref:Ubiquinone/menaquinone biosynthesis C-methylase UbiE n=1 Tax=Roseibium hamelinense TaxID=150831 RepID=A0A562SE38_9HYPH|nr:class I SAM-dependent methyltransferase [Roseibium hamelinense]MTI42585.1 methyltransferase domain-containing protein [Roseibium hamelinense]TWI79537.1 ubiquinone/menaquinone biosynthesis C-methylase UbiE [Roseibium hamelinense]